VTFINGRCIFGSDELRTEQHCGVDYLWDLSSVAVGVPVVGGGQWSSRRMVLMVEGYTHGLVKRW
jgi:hypothetical protein